MQEHADNTSGNGVLRIGVKENVLRGRHEIREVAASRGVPKPGMRHFMSDNGTNRTLVHDHQQWQTNGQRDMLPEHSGIPAFFRDRSVEIGVDQQSALRSDKAAIELLPYRPESRGGLLIGFETAMLARRQEQER